MDTPASSLPVSEHGVSASDDPRFDFFRYAVDRGMLRPEVASAMREAVATERIPVGQILLHEGHLSVRQVMQVLAIQADSPQLRFGEIAVREGFVDTLQLQAALERQVVLRRHPIDALRRSGAIPIGELDSLMMDYVRFLELQLAHMEPNQGLELA